MASMIIVSGPSASGKSTLADRLAADLSLPVIHRDRIKEALFDALGSSDRERSKELGVASALVNLRMLEDVLKNGASCIAEAKFIPKFCNDELRQLLADTNSEAIQIQCSADGTVLLERFTKRANSVERHPGHNEADNIDDFKDELLAGKLPHLDLGGDVLEYETTEQDEDRYQQLLQAIRTKLGTRE